MPTYKKQYSYFLIGCCIMLLFANCHNFYKGVQTHASTNNAKANVVDSLQNINRYFILRNGNQSYYMNNVVLDKDKKTLTCSLETVPYYHQKHLPSGRKEKMRYKKNEPADAQVLSEVHFYIHPDATAALGQYTLALDKVELVEVIEKDKARTASSYIIGAIGYTLGAVAVVAIIVAATKSSCPFVSAYDGNNFSLQGEIYGGAIYPQLARHDYLPLKMAPMQDGSLQVKITNELHEHQFTDMAELWVITHNKNSNVLADEKGNLFTVTDPQPPIAATLNDQKNVTAALQKAGDNTLLYMDDSSASATNNVVMQFNKPATAKKARLMLTLKNSYFLDLLYGELAKGFGSYYGTYIKQQEQKPAAELLKWTKEQQIPLEVDIETKTGWKKITDITTTGPLATRNIVVPIDLPESSEPFTAIKLSSGFMFWEIDYAGIDYSEENNFTLEKVIPSRATDETGKNVLADLCKEDGIYLAQPDIGNSATIVYQTAPLNDNSKTRTYILHSKGYYEHVRDFKNKPDINFLNQFKQPGAFPLFGIQVYKKINAANISALVKSN